ncbi:MAG: hypothetical protein J6Y13_07330 [Treponema sp.]|nr:hypothetical protein [Treponema sp.]
MTTKACIASALVCSLICSFLCASSYRKKYLKGNITDKVQAVKEAAASSDNIFIGEALDFAVATHDEIGDDKELDQLLESSVRSLDIKVLPPDKKEKASRNLGKAFQTFSSRSVRSCILDSFAAGLSPENLETVNSFVAARAQDEADNPGKDTMDSLVEKSLGILQKHGNRVSFNIMFIADLMDVWSSHRELLEASFASLAASAENEILKIADSAGVPQRLKILSIIGSNVGISKKIKGKVAEKLLSDQITSARDDKGVFASKEDALLYAQSVSLAASCRWTRSAQDIADSFAIASKSYAWGLLDTDRFCTLIADMAQVSCPDTGRFLSHYLDSLNNDMKSGAVPEEAVVLSVIKALGGLGDKAAFDYLLSVTYLDYPSDVTDAARLALAKLKW